MSDVHEYKAKMSNVDLQLIADAVIGGHQNNPSKLLESHANFGFHCNYTDLCDDADSIGIAKLLKGKKQEIHTLSSTLREYYNSLTNIKRYSQYAYDGLDFSSLEKLNESVWNKMNGNFENIDFLKFKGLKGKSTELEQKATCKSFAKYIWKKSR